MSHTFFDRFPQDADSTVSSDNAGGTAVKEMPLEGLQVAAGFVRRLLGEGGADESGVGWRCP